MATEKTLKPGYHLANIPRGDLGQSSKMAEELAEFDDAMAQGVRIMALVELSDLYGAMEAVLATHFPGFTMADLAAMATVTKRAFDNGTRTSR